MNITELAKEAGVSISTVSKILNNKDAHISAKTRDLILEIARENNYTPYQKVFNNISVKVTSIALIITDVSDVFCSELLKGVEDYFFKKNYNVIICNTYGDSKKEQEYITMLKEKNIQGIISFPNPALNNKFIDNLTKDNIQCVILENYKQIPNVMKSYFNNEEGGYLACKHLISRGHSHIGFITKSLKFPFLQERYEGYKRALLEHKLDFNENLIYSSESTNDKEVGFFGTKHLMSQGVSAIFCCDDRVAVGAYNAILETKYKIPEDISIVGFDDSIICELLNPKLTSVRQSAYDIGVNSANMLYNKLNNLDMVIEDVQIEPKLIIRESTNEPGKNLSLENENTIIIGNLQMNTILEANNFQDEKLNVSQNLINEFDGFLFDVLTRNEIKKDSIFAIGRVGNDLNGKNIFNQLLDLGIKTDGIVFDKNFPTGTKYTVLSDKKVCSSVIHKGANEKISIKQIDSLNWIFDKTSTCIIDNDIPNDIKEYVLKLCKKKKINVRS